MALPRLENAQVNNRRALVRADFELALNAAGQVQFPAALHALKPTVELLRSRGASITLISHGGAPDDAASARQSFAPLAEPLTQILGAPVRLAELANAEPAPGEITLVENLLQHDGERTATGAFAKQLAAKGDLFVNDAFGASRHTLASTVKLPELLPACAGVALYKEEDALQQLLNRDRRPLVVIVGGVRLGNKMKFLLKLMEKIQTVLVGGGAAFTFLKSRAVPVGASFVERDLEVPAFQMIERAQLAETDFVLPVDFIAADQLSRDAKTKSVAANGVPARWIGLDIGGKTIARFEKEIKSAGALFWYGPLGAIELEKFSKGNRAIAQAVSKSKAFRVAAGADAINALYEYGLADRFDHLCISSAAALERLSGARLPGLVALDDAQPA